MSELRPINLDIKNKLGVTTWKTDTHKNQHITVKPEICAKCPHQLCIAGCPTECFKFYEIEGVEKMKFQFEDGFELQNMNIFGGI